MRLFEPKTIEEINELLHYLCRCHDGSIKRISFLKDRELNENGDLVYPFVDIAEMANCNIEVELLLSTYPTAKKDQIVLLQFNGVRYFRFMQDPNFDYSDVYDLGFEPDDTNNLNFIFYSTKNRIESLKISCRKIVCKEV